MGHSVKRKEDPRFIRGQGEYIDDVNLPGQLWLDIVRSPYAHATIKCDRRDARRSRSRASLAVITGKDLERLQARTGCRPSPATSRWCCRRTRSCTRRRRSRRSSRPRRYAAADGVAAVLVDYEPLPVIVDPHKALEPDALVLRPDRGPDKQNNHIWHWESGDQAATDAAIAAAEVRVERGHLHPAHPRRLDRDVRLRRRLGPGPPAAHAAHDDARRRTPSGRSSRSSRRRRPADLRAEHPGQDPRHRRRLRRQGAGLPGLRARRRRLVPDRQAGQVDRGPLGEPPGRLVRPRLPHPRRAGARRRTARSPALKVKTLADHGYTDAAADPSKFPAGLFNVITGSYDFHERVRRGRRRLHQQAARRRRLPLLVPGDRGGPRHRADGRHPRPRHRQGPGPAPDGELHPARAVPVQDADRLGVRLGQLPGRAPEGDGHDRLRRAAQGAGREARARRADGHRHQQLHRDRRRRAVARLRHPRASRCSTRARSGSIRPARSSPGSASRRQGQGHETTFAQIIAEELGFPVADIKIEDGDTDTAPYGLGTYASRSTPVAGAATAMAARKIQAKARKHRRAPARGQRGRPRVGARQVQRQGLARPVQDDPGDRLRGLHQPSRRGWRPASRRSTTTTRRT